MLERAQTSIINAKIGGYVILCKLQLRHTRKSIAERQHNGATENARNEISAPSKMQVEKIRDMKIQVRKKRDMKIRDMKMREMKIREKCDFGLGEH